MKRCVAEQTASDTTGAVFSIGDSVFVSNGELIVQIPNELGEFDSFLREALVHRFKQFASWWAQEAVP